MGKLNIYDHDPIYSFFRPYVDWCCKKSYKRVEIKGEENLPDNGAVILAPNHCNTLMDALVVLRAFKDETVFGARADMFKNKTLAKLMFFLRIVPMVRQRDGLRNVLKNHETTQIIADTLENGVRFCMYPEGRHRPARSIMHLGKGIIRAALASNEQFGDRKPVYIVPVGLEYGDYFRYRSTSLLTYGKPINVTEFVRNTEVEHEAHLIDGIRSILKDRMSSLITYIPDDEDLEPKWTLLKMLASREKRKGSLYDNMIANKKIAERIENRMKADKDSFKSLLERVRDFEAKRKRKGLSIYSFGKDDTAMRAAVKSLFSLILMSWFVFCSITSLPMWGIFELLKTKIRDRAFHNTAGFAIKTAGGPVMFLIWAVTFFMLLPWYAAVPALMLTVPAYGSFYDCLRFFRRTISDLKIAADPAIRKQYDSIINDFEKQ